MNLHYEKNFIKGVDDLNLVQYLFQRYGNVYPQTDYAVQLFGKARQSKKIGQVAIAPFDKKLSSVMIECAPDDPNVIYNMTFQFVEENLTFHDLINAFGPCEFEFDADRMVSALSFNKVKAVQITKISFVKKGKLGQEDGKFYLIDPKTYDRIWFEPEELKFDCCRFYFRVATW